MRPEARRHRGRHWVVRRGLDPKEAKLARRGSIAFVLNQHFGMPFRVQRIRRVFSEFPWIATRRENSVIASNGPHREVGRPEQGPGAQAAPVPRAGQRGPPESAKKVAVTIQFLGTAAFQFLMYNFDATL